MKGLTQENICPRCQFSKMKSWEQLNDEEKMLVERLPMSATLSPVQRKKNIFCPRCWHEQIPNFNEIC